MSLFLCLTRDASSRNTPPPGDPSGGVFYLRIVLSPEEASRPWVFINRIFLRGWVVSASPNPQAGGPPLVGCPPLLIQFIRSYPPYRRPFLHPQPEDAPWRGDRDPQIPPSYTLQFLTRCCTNLSATMGKCSNVNDDCVEVWCIQSATHVPRRD